MDFDEFRRNLEGFGLDQNQIEELIASLEASGSKINNQLIVNKNEQEIFLKNQLILEKDYRKRALIAARLLNLGLE